MVAVACGGEALLVVGGLVVKGFSICLSKAPVSQYSYISTVISQSSPSRLLLHCHTQTLDALSPV